jgi:hypothetical protein
MIRCLAVGALFLLLLVLLFAAVVAAADVAGAVAAGFAGVAALVIPFVSGRCWKEDQILPEVAVPAAAG